MAFQVAVSGPGECTEEEARTARRLGELLAGRGAVVLCGGRDAGVMAAVAAGARAAGGLTVGILPGSSRAGASPDLAVAITTGMGEARNSLLVKCADALVVVKGLNAKQQAPPLKLDQLRAGTHFDSGRRRRQMADVDPNANAGLLRRKVSRQCLNCSTFHQCDHRGRCEHIEVARTDGTRKHGRIHHAPHLADQSNCQCHIVLTSVTRPHRAEAPPKTTLPHAPSRDRHARCLVLGACQGRRCPEATCCTTPAVRCITSRVLSTPPSRNIRAARASLGRPRSRSPSTATTGARPAQRSGLGAHPGLRPQIVLVPRVTSGRKQS